MKRHLPTFSLLRIFHSCALVTFVCIGSFTQTLNAQSIIDWKNNAGSSAWATGSNWDGNTAPADDLTSSIARFNQASYVSQPNAGTRSIAGLVFGDGVTSTGSLTISGTVLTLGASGIVVNSGAGASALNVTTLALGANQIWNVGSGTTLSATAPGITGAFALEKNGSGTLLLGSSTASTFSGGFTLTAGTLRLNSNTALGTATVALNGGTISTTGASPRTLANALTLGGDVQLGDSGFAGTVTYNGLLTVIGDRQITLLNTGGSLAGGVSLNGNLTVNSQIAAAAQQAGNTIGSVIADGSAPHSLTKIGSGMLLLSAANTYSGGTTLNDGFLYVGSSTALGTGNVNFGGGVLDLRGQNLIVNALTGSLGSITDTAGPGTRTLTVGQGGNSGSFDGTISQSASNRVIAITKSGAGTQAFNGNNTYIGQTKINQGTLLINGTHVDESGNANGFGSTTAGHFQVESAATLGGFGRISGNNSAISNSNLVLVKSGGSLAPGVDIGTLTLDGANFSGTGSKVLNMNSGASFVFELAGDGTSADQIRFWNYVTTDVLLSNNAVNLSLNGSHVAGTYTVSLFQFFSDSGTSLTLSGISSGLVIGSLGSGIQSANLNYNANTISLTYTVVPEPNTILLLGASLLVVLLFRRRARANRHSGLYE